MNGSGVIYHSYCQPQAKEREGFTLRGRGGGDFLYILDHFCFFKNRKIATKLR